MAPWMSTLSAAATWQQLCAALGAGSQPLDILRMGSFLHVLNIPLIPPPPVDSMCGFD